MSDVAAVFQIGSLGDSIVSVPTLLSLKELLPACSDYLLISRFDSNLKVAPSHVFDMAWKAKGQIVYRGPNKGVRQIASIANVIARLRYYRPRYCVYLMPSDRSRKQVERDKLFFMMGGVNELIGFRALTHEELGAGPIPRIRDTEAYLRFLRVWNGAANETFARYSASPVLAPGQTAKQQVHRWLSAERRHPDRRLVVLCPYSNWPSKDLPDQTIIDLLRLLEHTANAEVVLLGGKKDSGRAQAALLRSGTGLNACGAFSVEESAALLKTCSLAVCTDSGPMHLAGALGIPSLIIFSRIYTPLSRWFPLGEQHTILYRELECAGCSAINCLVKGHPCMRDITVNQILAAALSKLNGFSLAPGLLGGTRAVAW